MPSVEPAPKASRNDTKQRGERLRSAVATIARLRSEGASAVAILSHLEELGATCRFTGGTNVLRLAGISASSTAGGDSLVSAWVNAACRKAPELVLAFTGEDGLVFVAYADRQGVIGFCHRDIVPSGTMVFVEGGDLSALTDLVSSVARHAYAGTSLLVPGVPEARDDVQARQALTKWAAWAFNSVPRLVEETRP